MVNPTGRVELPFFFFFMGGHDLQSMDFCVLECKNLLTFILFYSGSVILLLLCYDIV
jgi:hypothetical protein